MEHEVWLTEAELRLNKLFTRDVPVGRTHADAAFNHAKMTFYVEVDNHTMSPKQVRAKFVAYGEVKGIVLVVCHTKPRLRRLMRWAAPLKNVALFTLFRWLRLDQPWIGCIDGKLQMTRI